MRELRRALQPQDALHGAQLHPALHMAVRDLFKQGKALLPASQIPEETLIALTCEVLDVEKLTEEAVDALDEIRVTGKGCLRFALRDGRVEERQWAWESRAKAWTPEMRRKASEQMKRRWRHD